MRRDVNLGLLLLILAAAVIFSGFSVYYQTTFKNVSLEYQNKLDQLNTVSQELLQQKEELNETYSLRIRAEQDRQALDTQFRDAADENEQLKDSVASLQTELGVTKSDLSSKTAELDATKNLLAQTQTDLDQANTRIAVLKNDLDEVCDDYETVAGSEHDEC